MSRVPPARSMRAGARASTTIRSSSGRGMRRSGGRAAVAEELGAERLAPRRLLREEEGPLDGAEARRPRRKALRPEPRLEFVAQLGTGGQQSARPRPG